MRVFSINYILCDEINENFDFEWQNTQFGYYVKNNFYVPVNLDEDYLEDLSEDYEVPGTEYLTYEFTEKVCSILESIMLYNNKFQYRLVNSPWRDNTGGVVVLCWTDHEGKLREMDWEYMYYEKGENAK